MGGRAGKAFVGGGGKSPGGETERNRQGRHGQRQPIPSPNGIPALRDIIGETFISFAGGRSHDGQFLPSHSDIARIEVLLGGKKLLELDMSEDEATKLASHSDLSLLNLEDNSWSEIKVDDTSGVAYRATCQTAEEEKAALARVVLPLEQSEYGSGLVLRIVHRSPLARGGVGVSIYSSVKEKYIPVGELPYMDTFTETHLQVPPSVIADIFGVQKMMSDDNDTFEDDGWIPSSDPTKNLSPAAA